MYRLRSWSFWMVAAFYNGWWLPSDDAIVDEDQAITTRVSTFPLRLPVPLKTALEKISERDGTSMNQFLVVAAAEKIAKMQTEEFFLDRRNRSDHEALRRILNREGREAPRPEDTLKS